MRGTTWHVTGPLGKRQLNARFDARVPTTLDLDLDLYIKLRGQYFDALARAAREAAVAWMPATGDVYVFSADPASRPHVEAILIEIVNSTPISFDIDTARQLDGVA